MPNDSFNWRPNDHGSLTNLRYNLEAEKWVNAVNSAHRKLPSGNFGADLGFIGACIQLPLLLILMIFLIPIVLIKEIFGFSIKVFPGDEPTGFVKKTFSEENPAEFKARLDAISEKHRGKGRKKRGKKQWEDLTAEEQRLVRMVREETAKAKANWK